MNFTIVAKIKNKSYACDTELSKEENKIFTDLGLKNFTTGDNINDINEYNESVIENFDKETYDFFSKKVFEIIEQDYSEYELYDVCFETVVVNPTYIL